MIQVLYAMRKPWFARAVISAPLLAASLSFASPGAHGPNGEHLDTASSGQKSADAAPRFDAKSELFELVARLDGGELSMLIDRFDTNEPVLKADVEIESGNRKAKAKFHADLGDYAVDDAEMLKLLGTPGEHPIVVTILAGSDTDLLEGVLRVGDAQVASVQAHAHGDSGGHDHGGSAGWRWAAGGLLLLVAVVLSWRWRQRTTGDAVSRTLEGGQA